MTRIAAWTRTLLLKIRIGTLAEPTVADPQAPAYLFLIQQSKRLSLSRSIGHVRPRNLLLLPLLVAIILVKAVDLWLTSLLIRSLINERDLQRQVTETSPSE